MTPDGVQYLALARDLGSGYFDSNSELFVVGLSRTPVYPLFAAFWLAIGLGSVTAVIAAQIALGVAVVGLTYILTRRLLGPREALAAAWVLSLDPATALYCVFFQPETLFTALVLLAAWVWVEALDSRREQAAAMAGLLVGVSALTRPIGVLLPAAFAVIAFLRIRRPGVRLLAAGFLPFFLVVSGWVTRNAVYTGAPVLSTIEGVNLLYYRAADALAIDRGISIEAARAQLQERIDRDPSAQGNVARRSQAESALALRVLAEHPWGALRSAGHGVVSLLLGTGFTALSNLLGDSEPTVLESVAEMSGATGLAGLLALWYLAAGVGAVDLARSARHVPLLLFLVLAGYFILMSAGPEANTRFRVPAMPFVAALGGRGFVWAADRWIHRPSRPSRPPRPEPPRPSATRVRTASRSSKPHA